jgi:hypothetical protein
MTVRGRLLLFGGFFAIVILLVVVVAIIGAIRPKYVQHLGAFHRGIEVPHRQVRASVLFRSCR